ncbi:hypothetical protein [Nocardia araoensis]|uniref:hypothetical protein n=1 Tax=Nocardia araoensis TaxID=228600 RepID=UPI0012F6796E|nr:hypothetical protein [Nocardia araoensis]
MTSRFVDWFRGRSEHGQIARGLAGFLKATHQRTPRGDTHVPNAGDGMTSGEKSVIASVDNSLAAADQHASRGLLRRMKKLVAKAHTNERRWSALAKLCEHPKWQAARVGRAVRDHETFDHDHALSSPKMLLIIEIVLLVVEFFFWYATFTETIDPAAGLLYPGRINAALLALFVPLAGIGAARLAGGLSHRWFHDYAGVSRRRHSGAVIAVILFAVLVFAVVWLVLVRFGESSTALGSTSLPAPAMAVLFGAVLVVDMASRTFLVSEIRHQYQRRSVEFRKLEKKLIKANAAHAKAWVAVRSEIESGYQRAVRIETVGSKLLSDSEALHGNPRRVHTEPPESIALETVEFDDDRSAMSIPSTQLLRLIRPELGLAPSRALEGARDLLIRYRPWDPDQLTAKVTGVWRQLHDADDDQVEVDERAERGWGGVSGRQAS